MDLQALREMANAADGMDRHMLKTLLDHCERAERNLAVTDDALEEETKLRQKAERERDAALTKLDECGWHVSAACDSALDANGKQYKAESALATARADALEAAASVCDGLPPGYATYGSFDLRDGCEACAGAIRALARQPTTGD